MRACIQNTTGVRVTMIMHAKHNRSGNCHVNAVELGSLELLAADLVKLLPVEMMVVERMAAYVYDTIGL